MNPLIYFWLILIYSIGIISDILEDNIARRSPMFIENCLVNNCLIMITVKANIFLSLLKYIDADW